MFTYNKFHKVVEQGLKNAVEKARTINKIKQEKRASRARSLIVLKSFEKLYEMMRKL